MQTRRAAAPRRAHGAGSLLAACGALALAAALGCAGGDSEEAAREAAQPEDLVAPGPHEAVVLEMADLGSIRIELLPEIAPATVAHFKKLVSEGFYDDTTFHRVIPGFMIQGGDPLTRNNDPRDDGRGGPGYAIADEFSAYPHVRGTVSMANTGSQGSGGSQFFIVHEDSPHLDGGFTVFGRVVDGLETVDAVTKLEIDKFGRYGPADRPYPHDARVERFRLETSAAGGSETPAAGSEAPSTDTAGARARDAPSPTASAS